MAKIKQVLLLDLDNCPKQIEKLPQTMDDYLRVVVCYQGSEPRVPLNLVTFFGAMMNSGRMEIMKMQRNGKNATDFGLAFWAGRLVSELPEDTEFFIVSNDRDLDNVVDLLEQSGRVAFRINSTSNAAMPPNHQSMGPTSARIADPKTDDYAVLFFNERIHGAQSLPRKRKTLQNAVKSFFKKDKHVAPAAIVECLIERGLVRVDENGRLDYLEDWETRETPELDLDENVPF